MAGLAETELDNDRGRKLRIAGGIVLLAAIVALLFFVVKNLGKSEPGRQKQIARITVVPDTPPPPPPPPPKEAPKEVKETKMEQPKQVEAPPDPQVKMEGEAGEGASPFAAGKVDKDYIGGNIGGGGGLQFAWFSNALQRHIQDQLARNRKIKLGDYRVMVNVWLNSDGTIRRADLVGSTGNPDTDKTLRAALTDVGPVREAVPADLPQPIKLRISNKVMG